MRHLFGALTGAVALTAVLSVALAAAEPKAEPQAAKAPQAAAKEEKPLPPAAKGQKAPPAPAKEEKPPPAAPKVEKAPPAAPSETGPTHKVKKELFKIELSLKGAFEPERTAEIVLRPQQWAAFEVVEAVEHGARVKRGDVLVRFDTEKIAEEIADLKTRAAISELAFRQTEENLRALEASTPLDLKAAERAKQIADEDLATFLKVDRQLMEKSANRSLKFSEFYLELQKEELRQLEKMYRADDLTEETEEIVLKRARHDVESAEFSAEQARVRHEQSLKVDIPRKQEGLEQAAKKQDIAWTKAKVTFPVTLQTAQREFEKSKVDRARDEAKLKKVLADREAMTIKAPLDGIVYYGRFVRGKWSGMEALAESLRRGGNVMKNAVMMTVVEPRPLVVRCTVGEADLAKVRPGMKATVRPAVLPETRLEARVARVDSIPAAADNFEVRLEVKLDEKAAAVVPGMACTVKLVPYLEKDALVVPARALFADELDDEKSYVFVTADGGKTSKKQYVTVGKRSDDRAEIVRGLAAGDEILLERPKDAAPAGDAKKPEAAGKPAR